MSEQEAVEVTEVEQSETNEQVSTPETVENEAKAAEEVTEQPEKTFTQAELDEILQKRLSKQERKFERERIRAEEREKAKTELQQSEQPINKPKLEDYDTYEAYYEELADWKAEQKFKQIQERESQAKQQESQRTEQERIRSLIADVTAVGERKYDDYEDALVADKNTYSEIAINAALESDVGADILYYLATHQDEAAKISKLSPYAQAKEIGRLEVQLTTKPAKKQSDAPAPIKPVGSAKATSLTYSPDMSDADYAKWRDAQKRA